MSMLESILPRTDRDDSLPGALELLLNATLPIILILMIEVVVSRKIQADIIDRLQGEMDAGGISTIRELVDDAQRQRLLARIEAVLKGREETLQLPAFPMAKGADRSTLAVPFAFDQEGFARDPRFRELCKEAKSVFERQTIDQFTVEIFKAALAVDDDGRVMYDHVHRPAPKAVTKDADIVTAANRDFALKLIAGRLTEFRNRVIDIQIAAVESVLVAKSTTVIEKEFGADEQRVVRARILAAFDKRAIPLLPSVVAE